MIEDNNRMIEQFFNETAPQQIADNGFTERVMQHLPQCSPLAARSRLLIYLWNLCCVVVFAILFVLIDGWELLTVQFEVMLQTMAVQTFSVNLLMAVSVLFGLLFVGVGEIISSESARR